MTVSMSVYRGDRCIGLYGRCFCVPSFTFVTYYTGFFWWSSPYACVLVKLIFVMYPIKHKSINVNSLFSQISFVSFFSPSLCSLLSISLYIHVCISWLGMGGIVEQRRGEFGQAEHFTEILFMVLRALWFRTCHLYVLRLYQHTHLSKQARERRNICSVIYFHTLLI